MNWSFFAIPLLLFSVLPVYADFHTEMIHFMPDVSNFDENWKYTQVQGFKNLELDWSEETPDGLIQRFVLIDQTDETEMINTVSIYEFDDKETSSTLYDEYVTTLIENDYPEAPLEASLQDNCFATRINHGEPNEKTSIVCTNSQYTIISTSEQTGYVFHQDKQLTTMLAANAFANMIYENMEEAKLNQVPEWIKILVNWWSQDKISDTEFIEGIQYLVQQEVIIIPDTEELSAEFQLTEIPEEIKNNFGLWSQDKISDTEFIEGIQYLVQHGIIQS